MRREEQEALQRPIATLLDSLGWLWCHVPNGGARSKAEAAILKGLGVKSGAPDILIFEDWRAGDDYGHGLALELKKPGEEPSDDQEDWLIALEKRGWYAEVVDDLDRFLYIAKTFVRPLNRRSPR